MSLEDVDIPAPGRGQYLVRVTAAALNYFDLLMTAGQYQDRPALPATLGHDFCGVIVAVGPPPHAFQFPVIGAEVMGLRHGGAFAEYLVVDGDDLLLKPSTFTIEQAAAFTTSYLTAEVALGQLAQVRNGDWLLVHGASGGIGLAAVNLGKAIGANVIATSSDDEKLEAIKKMYRPDEVLNICGDFRDTVKQMTNGGAQIVFDPVGGDVFDESIRCTAFGGRYLIVGFSSGQIPTIQTNYPLIKGLQLIGVRAGEYRRRFKNKAKLISMRLEALAMSRKVSPFVGKTFPLEDWRDAFITMRSRKFLGKIVFVLT